MAKTEPNPVGGSIPPWPYEEPEVVANPGQIQVLDRGVPWIRTGEELDREWMRLWQRMSRVLEARQGEDLVDGPQTALLGVFSAARWTLGRTPMSPMLW